MKVVVILLALASSGCVATLSRGVAIYTPLGCDAAPEQCRLCPPGWMWVKSAGCRPRPVATPPVPSPEPTPTAPTAGPTTAPTPVSPTPTPGFRPCVSPADCFCADQDGAYRWCPTPAPSTPTPVPTLQPTPAPAMACMLDGPPWVKGAPPHPVPVRGIRTCDAPRSWFTMPSGDRICLADWPGGPGGSRFRGLWVSFSSNHVHITESGYISDGHAGPVPSCGLMEQDAFGRIVCNGELHEITGNGDCPEPCPPFGRIGIAEPPRCPPEITVPTTPSGGVEGFMLGWTNVSDKCRGFRDLGGGWGECEPDGAHRFKGRLKPQDKLVQNVCDRDHWHCAIERCEKPPEKAESEWQRILQDHRDVYQMCGGDEWITPAGIRHEWRYADHPGTVYVADQARNPYQASFTAASGAAVEARGCMPEGAYACPAEARKPDEYDCPPETRRPIPGAGNCGPWKPYRVQ